MDNVLSWLVFMPLAFAVAVMFLPEAQARAVKVFGLIGSLATFGVSLYALSLFQSGTYHFQLVESVPWVPDLGITYKLGMDGISVWLVVLTTFLMVICSWFSFYIDKRVKSYFVYMLVLETAMLGVFLSLDLVLFYTFFEASLVPMALLIYKWGGENRKYAATKFFIYTFAASIFMLIGIVWLSNLALHSTGARTFDLLVIQSAVADGSLWAGAMQAQPVIFWLFTIALMVKCPMFPFHTWLPDAHTEAPTAGSVILAGVLLKMGTYGFLRFVLPLFPDVLPAQIPVLMVFAVIGIVYGAIVAAMQPDLKRLVAYSSVAHMGFVVIGVFSLTHNGLMGGSYQQLSHGISTGALFLLVGLLYERIHTRMFKDMGGLKAKMPVFAAIFLIIMLSSVGLPGLNGFIGEFLALFGAFEAAATGQFGLGWWLPLLAGAGVVLAAVYLLWMFQKVFYGPVTNPVLERIKDLKAWEVAMCSSLVLFAVWGGLYPATFLTPMEKSIAAARQMAVNEPGKRPSWTDPMLEIGENGDLVRVQEDRQPLEMDRYTVASTVSPANHHAAVPTEVAP
jgi:NADH-quinone oxidoreductase subunit M